MKTPKIFYLLKMFEDHKLKKNERVCYVTFECTEFEDRRIEDMELVIDYDIDTLEGFRTLEMDIYHNQYGFEAGIDKAQLDKEREFHGSMYVKILFVKVFE